MEIRDIVFAIIAVGLVVIVFITKLSSYQSAKAQKTSSYAMIAIAAVFILIVFGWLATQYDYDKMSADFKGGKLELSLQQSKRNSAGDSVSVQDSINFEVPAEKINQGWKMIGKIAGSLDELFNKPKDKPDSL
ncbi:MAG: hypothetical protein AABW50_04255 [Nanoarchaeota archaeon]